MMDVDLPALGISENYPGLLNSGKNKAYAIRPSPDQSAKYHAPIKRRALIEAGYPTCSSIGASTGSKNSTLVDPLQQSLALLEAFFNESIFNPASKLGAVSQTPSKRSSKTSLAPLPPFSSRPGAMKPVTTTENIRLKLTTGPPPALQHSNPTPSSSSPPPPPPINPVRQLILELQEVLNAMKALDPESRSSSASASSTRPPPAPKIIQLHNGIGDCTCTSPLSPETTKMASQIYGALIPPSTGTACPLTVHVISLGASSTGVKDNYCILDSNGCTCEEASRFGVYFQKRVRERASSQVASHRHWTHTCPEMVLSRLETAASKVANPPSSLDQTSRLQTLQSHLKTVGAMDGFEESFTCDLLLTQLESIINKPRGMRYCDSMFDFAKAIKMSGGESLFRRTTTGDFTTSTMEWLKELRMALVLPSASSNTKELCIRSITTERARIGFVSLRNNTR